MVKITYIWIPNAYMHLLKVVIRLRYMPQEIYLLRYLFVYGKDKGEIMYRHVYVYAHNNYTNAL